MSAARRPTSTMSLRTVVSPGVTRLATSMSSNPTTETSSGTRRPASRSRRIAPRAIESLWAKMQVNGTPLARSSDTI